MEGTAPSVYIVSGCIAGSLAAGMPSIAALLVPLALLLIAVGIMCHATEQRKLVCEDFADLRKRIDKLESNTSEQKPADNQQQ